MAVKLVVLYTQPDDTTAFDEHYLSTHMELAREIPGLQRVETGRFVAALDGGEQTYYRMAEMIFADRAALDAGLQSDEARANGRDYRKIAPAGSRMFIQDVDE